MNKIYKIYNERNGEIQNIVEKNAEYYTRIIIWQ